MINWIKRLYWRFRNRRIPISKVGVVPGTGNIPHQGYDLPWEKIPIPNIPVATEECFIRVVNDGVSYNRVETQFTDKFKPQGCHNY